MGKVKIFAISAILILMVSAVAASSFGSFSSKNQKQIETQEANFEIKVFNMGEKPLRLEISSTDVEDGSIVHPEEMTLEPSKITRNPSDKDSEWFLTSDGRYVKTQTVPIRVFLDGQRSSNKLEFDVDIKASESSDQGDEGVVQNIAQVRTYSYTVETTSSNSGTGVAGDSTEPNPTEQQPRNSGQNNVGQTVSEGAQNIADTIGGAVSGLTASQDNTDQQSNEGENEQNNLDSRSVQDFEQQNQKTNQEASQEGSKKGPTGNFFQAVGVNTVTIMMFLLLAGSTLYLIRVI